MNKFQNFKFNSIEEFFDFLPENQLKITLALRTLILEIMPHCKEKLSYNVPFYSIHKRVCFIWPGAVPWGNNFKEGVQLGFCEGHLLYDPENYLDKGDRKQVSWRVFYDCNEIDRDMIRTFLFDAVAVDQAFMKPKIHH